MIKLRIKLMFWSFWRFTETIAFWSYLFTIHSGHDHTEEAGEASGISKEVDSEGDHDVVCLDEKPKYVSQILIWYHTFKSVQAPVNCLHIWSIKLCCLTINNMLDHFHIHAFGKCLRNDDSSSHGCPELGWIQKSINIRPKCLCWITTFTLAWPRDKYQLEIPSA